MKLPNIRELKADAGYAYGRARDPRKLILAFAGISTLVSLLLTVVNSWLATQIEGTGGLSNFGIRSILSTVQSVLPIAQLVILLGLDFGYFHAILRMARGQYADHTDLKVGFHRFFPILRLNLLTAFRFSALAFVIFYGSTLIFTMTSWSDPLTELLLPLVEAAGTSADATLLLDEATLAQAYQAMVPLLVIFLVLYCAVAIPMFYKLRMSTYLLLDDPQGRAMLAMRRSTQMMKGNIFQLFKLDLSFWWYYLLTALAAVLSYGDVILPMLGVTLPFNDTVAYYLFYFIYLAALFAIYYFLRNRVEITYAKAYDSIVEKPRDNGVVLGSIFDV